MKTTLWKIKADQNAYDFVDNNYLAYYTDRYITEVHLAWHKTEIKTISETCSTNFRDKLLFVNSTKSFIFDLTKILLPKRLVLKYSLMAKVMHYRILFTELKSSC